MPGYLRNGLVVGACISSAVYAAYLWKGVWAAIPVGVFCSLGFVGTIVLTVFAWIMSFKND